MPIIRCTAQSSQSLYDLYTELSRQYKAGVEEGIFDETDIDGAAEILAFLKMADRLFPKTILWAVTDDSQLVLVSDNDPDSAWNVTVSLSNVEGYCFKYAKPDAGPDEWKTLKQKTTDLEEAKQFFLMAMNKSGAWDGNAELAAQLAG